MINLVWLNRERLFNNFKMKLFIFGLLFLVCINNSLAIFPKNIFPSHAEANADVGDVGEPLFLTPYIEAGNIEEARKLSKVGPLPNGPNITSYSGYITVDKKLNSNMFFWFIPALVSELL
jgi:hypothetical protein